MRKNNVVEINNPATFIKDPLTEILQQGARSLLSQALEMEIETVLNQYKDLKDQRGYQRVVRNGYMPERQIQTGIGPVSVESPRIRDRSPHVSERISFSSAILPPYRDITQSCGQDKKKAYPISVV